MAKVIEVRTEEKSRADRVLADARRNLHIVQKQLELAKAEAATAATAAGELQIAQKKLQADLCAATMRADQDRLAAALEDNERAQRLANSTVEQTALAQTEAEQREADLAAEVEAAQAAAANAAKAFEEAGKQEEQLASWRAALDAKATKDAIAEAGTVKSGDDHKAARDRLARLLGGDAMVTLYQQRAWFAAENEAQTSNLLLDAIVQGGVARADSEPLTSARMVASATFGLWIDCIQDAAEATLTRLTSAKKVLAELAQRDASVEGSEPLKSQLARIGQRAQEAVKRDAPGKEKAGFDAWRVLHTAEQELKKAELAAIAADPDTDLEQAPGLAGKRTAVDTARQAVEAADGAFLGGSPPPKQALDDYELAIPPDVLTDVIAFFDADMALDRVAAVDVADITQHLGQSESDYAAAEQADVRERRAVAMVDARVEATRRRRSASTGAAAAHKLLTIRGDR